MATTCSHCTSSLMGKRYVLRNDAPTCLKCYETTFANKCEKCKRVIGTDAKDLTYKDKHYHEDCFLCGGCNNSLANQQFITKDGALICTSCFDNTFSEKCDACHRNFNHGSQKVDYGGKNYHYDCFCCSICNKPIGSNSFMPNGNKFTCMNCHNSHFATKCGGCYKVLKKGGVKFGGISYHQECFVCRTCEIQLAGKKFASNDGKPFCQDCFIKQFAKKCYCCSQPISGLGTSTKFCTFEGRYWHTKCFNCTRCSKTLVSEGFLLQDNQIVCSDCGL